jgi:hypothetical protein
MVSRGQRQATGAQRHTDLVVADQRAQRRHQALVLDLLEALLPPLRGNSSLVCVHRVGSNAAVAQRRLGGHTGRGR